MIKQLTAKHPLKMLCQHLNISVSVYLAHHQHLTSRRRQRDQRLITHIRAAHVRGRGSYGPSKIQMELVEQSGIHLGINSIKRSRKAAGIRCIHKRKFRVTAVCKYKFSMCPITLSVNLILQSPIRCG